LATKKPLRRFSTEADHPTSNDQFQWDGKNRANFPVSSAIDKLRRLAPAAPPPTLDDIKKVQRGNYTVPTPFDQGKSIDSTQRVQQNFQQDQRLEAYPSLNQIDPAQSAQTQTNIGAIGTLEDNSEERTFSRTLFYGYGDNHIIMNGMGFQGSIIATPTMTYLWKPQHWDDVNAESMSLLHFVFPQPDVIVFGCGPVVKPIDPSVHHYLRTLNIPYELMSTHSAMGTFNLMNEEYRKVAAFVVAHDQSARYDAELMKHVRSNVNADAGDAF
jgi:uncharacterized protein